MRWVYSTGIVRDPRRSTISSPSLDGSRQNAALPRLGVALDPVEAVLALGRGHAEQDDPPGAVAAHPVDVAVVGVEDRGPRARHGLDHDALDVGQLADRVDPAQAEVVAGHVGHDRHVVAVVAQALAQDAAARDLEHGGVDGRVLEHHLGRLRPGHVALLDQPAVDDDAVGRGHPDPPAHQLEDVGDHPDRRRLAVRAGHGDDRDARRRPCREQRIDDRPGDVLRLALGRVGVHPEAGRGVDLDDRAAGLAHGPGDIGADEVDAGDVEADDPGRGLGDLDVVGVGLDGPVDRGPAGRHVAGQGELDPRPGRAGLVHREALVARRAPRPPRRPRSGSAPSRGRCRDAGRCWRCRPARGRCARRRRSPTPGRARRWPRPCRR